ncbi:MAG: alpha/beta hydrolase [Pseudonocardia sp.]|nr:alpha/beta hydrolase [Pseudonocardia sp.]
MPDPGQRAGTDSTGPGPGVRSADGTWIRTWNNDAAGLPLVISNGLGAPPAAWPRLADPACGFHAVSWYHRGLGGSARPADPTHITVADHAADLEATMDAADLERAILLGWSVGVNVAFEFARARPERVAAILAVAGLSGGAFRGLFGPSGLARELREPAGRIGAWLLRVVGPPAAGLASLLPRTLDAADRLGRAAPTRAVPGLADLGEVARAFSAHPWTYYSQLVLASANHQPMDTGFVTFPVTVIAGLLDPLAAGDDLRTMAGCIPGARFVALHGTHFLPLQYPGRLHAELCALAGRTDLGPTDHGR